LLEILKTMKLKFIFFSIIFSMGILFTNPVKTNAQCSLCNANVQTGLKSNVKKTGLGLNDGIYLLLFMPYVLVGVVGALWYMNKRRQVGH